MNAYSVVNILDMIEAIGENEVNGILSDFSCPKNAEIEYFLKNNAIDFAKKKMSATHLIVDENGNVVAYFTLTHKAVKIKESILTATQKKKMQRYSQLDEGSSDYLASAFLIAQFGKNYADGIECQPNGDSMMASAMEILSSVQHDVGGGIVYLECEDKPALLSFYQDNCFRIFGKRYSESEKTDYIQLLRFF